MAVTMIPDLIGHENPGYGIRASVMKSMNQLFSPEEPRFTVVNDYRLHKQASSPSIVFTVTNIIRCIGLQFQKPIIQACGCRPSNAPTI